MLGKNLTKEGIQKLSASKEFKEFLMKGLNKGNDEIPRMQDPFEDDCKYRAYLIEYGFEVVKYMNPKQITKADEQDAQLKKRAEEESAKQDAFNWQRRLTSVNIPEMHLGCTFDNYEITDAKQQRYVDLLKTDKKNWFIFCGKTGTGKNHLAAAVIRERLASGRSAVLWKVKRLMDEQLSLSAVEKVQKLRELESVDLLVLNELGRTSEKKFFQDTIFDLLDERHENNKQTILITNLTKEELFSLFTPKYASGNDDTSLQRRLSHSCVFEFTWNAWVPKGKPQMLFKIEEEK